MPDLPDRTYAAVVKRAGALLTRVDPVDLALVVCFAVVAEVERAASSANVLEGTAPAGLDAVLVLAVVLPLGWRRRRPFAAVVGIAVAITVTGALLGATVCFFGGFFPLLVAVHAAGAGSRPPYDRLALLVAALLVGPMPLWNANFDPGYDYFLPTAAVLLAWGSGRVARRWRERSALLATALEDSRRGRAAEAELAATLERGRIARELHDVVAHSLSIMVLQASAARLDATGPAAAALRAIEETGRDALVEMRRLLSVLRSDEVAELGPQPGLAALPDLVAGLRAAGLQTEVTTRGEARPLPEGTDVTAYRILQEALTNALRHGAGSPVSLDLEYADRSVRMTVTNPTGAGCEPTRDLWSGHGLAGIRERVAMFGGTVRSGCVGGTFRTEVELPTAVVS